MKPTESAPMHPSLEEQFHDSPCPHCGQVVSFFGTAAGTVLECPTCHTDVVVDPKTVEIRPIPASLETPRLLLRRLRSNDSEDLLSLMENEESFRFIDWAPMDLDGVNAWLVEDERSRLSLPSGSLVLGLELRGKGSLVGFAFLGRIHADPRQLQMVIMIHHGLRKQGFGTEAARGTLEFAFQGLRAHRVIAHSDAQDPAGLRMLEKAGLRCEGKAFKDTWRHGEWISTVAYALVEEEFTSLPSTRV
jgi:RimJ/RimL family protein N-acetyltransferase